MIRRPSSSMITASLMAVAGVAGGLEPIRTNAPNRRAPQRPAPVKAKPAAAAESWYRITAQGPDTCEVMIYDEIGYWGVTAKQFCQDLAAVTAKTITLRLNSPGGQVFDGFAIYSAIKAHPSTVNVKVDGLAASIASVIAMAGDSVTISKNAYVMIHDPASYAFGNAADLRKEAELLDMLRDSIAGVYAEKCGQDLETIKAKMAEETWMDGAAAVEFGLCDSLADDDGDEDGEDGETDLARTLAKVAIRTARLPESLKRIAANLIDPSSTVRRAGTPPAVLPVASPVSSTPPKPETPMALKIIVRDGKQFVNINGADHEVDGSTIVHTAPAPAPQPSNSAAPITAADLTAATAKAVADERAYRAEFDTAVASAGFDAKQAADFHTKFYGRPIDVVKEVASYAIGARAKPVGENGSNLPGSPAAKETNQPAGDPIAKITQEATERFHAQRDVRRSFGCNSNDREAAEYKTVLAKYVAGEIRFAKDNPGRTLITAKPAN